MELSSLGGGGQDKRERGGEGEERARGGRGEGKGEGGTKGKILRGKGTGGRRGIPPVHPSSIVWWPNRAMCKSAIARLE